MIAIKDEEKILKIHNLLPGRHVKLISSKDTKDRGWVSHPDQLKHLIGKIGCVQRIHENVLEAVKVRIDGDERFWSYQDLELVSDEPEPRIFHFDVSLLNTGV